MSTKLYWVAGPWPGKLAIAARPRGGDWLEEDIRAWHTSGVTAVMSLLTHEEARELELTSECAMATREGMDFYSLPILDRQVPRSPSPVAAILDDLATDLESGKHAVIHCRQGIGRSGMIAACLLVMRGMNPNSAVSEVEHARGLAVPETDEQRRWIDLFASWLAKVN